MEWIRPMTAKDWEQVAGIYRQGMETNLSTFETRCPSYEQWDKAHLAGGRYVCETNGRVAGWVALSPISARYAYRGVAELSIYVAGDEKRRGIGRALLEHEICSSEELGYWTLQSVVLEENGASLALHRSCGFRVVGMREKIACDRFGRWRNTVLLERRSSRPCFLPERQEESEKCRLSIRCGTTDESGVSQLF